MGGGCGSRGGAIGLSSLRRDFLPPLTTFCPGPDHGAVGQPAIILPGNEIAGGPVGVHRLTVTGGSASLVGLFGAVAQLGERCNRTAEVRGSIPLRSTSLPLGVTGNTSDSGSEESWFEPRRGNSKRGHRLTVIALRLSAEGM